MSEVNQELLSLLRVYKDGGVERLMGTHVVPQGDPKGMVQSRDVVYAPEANLSSRLYLPENIIPHQKLPRWSLLTAPEHPLPTAHDDSWTAIKWVASHVDGNGPEDWLNSYADFGKVFFAGDSSGANISHQMGLRQAQEKLSGFNVEGIVLVHPFFWGTQRIGCEATKQKKERIELIEGLWYLANPTTSGFDDPFFNPVLDPKFASLGCSGLLVLVAEKDPLRDRGYYCIL
ncbi:hypothetical protein Tsubulata_036662 [Turnera subulata]|uniref:Alpha/beta hydrolase fold-3 domain-containing protein n=1 Tax=Turnera subulata TaxID=218843 RepID=A0A9Q0G7Y4_9ROSI|nr:hypothetical protein Tsubulata_036662 [Turnera subulata]